MKCKRRELLRKLAYLPIMASQAAFANSDPNWPAKPMRLVVPFAAGGAADLAARVIAQQMSQSLGKPMLVENRGGADGAIAGLEVARAAADGYTVFMATASPLSYVPSVKRNPPYDPINDFTPISYFATFTFFMMVHPSVPVASMAELISFARANPGKLSYATGNTTSILAMAQFNAANKLNMVHVPYKGEAQAVGDLVPGRVQLMWATPAVLPQLSKAGMKPLAVLLPNRSALMPDVPTMAEVGQNLVSITPWGGFVGPAKMNKDITDRLSREFATVLRKPEIKDQLDKLGLPGRPSSPEEFGSFIREQLQIWDRALRDAGIAKDQ